MGSHLSRTRRGVPAAHCRLGPRPRPHRSLEIQLVDPKTGGCLSPHRRNPPPPVSAPPLIERDDIDEPTQSPARISRQLLPATPATSLGRIDDLIHQLPPVLLLPWIRLLLLHHNRHLVPLHRPAMVHDTSIRPRSFPALQLRGSVFGDDCDVRDVQPDQGPGCTTGEHGTRVHCRAQGRRLGFDALRLGRRHDDGAGTPPRLASLPFPAHLAWNWHPHPSLYHTLNLVSPSSFLSSL